MSAKVIAVAVLFVGIGGLAVSNWWKYLKEENLLPRRAAASTAAASRAAAGPAPVAAASGANASTAILYEPEPPKRRPRSGLQWNDPFQAEVADVITPPRMGMKARKPDYVVDLILIDGSRRRASINGTLYSMGDRIGVVEVARIERDGVVLRNREGKDLFVTLAELKSEKS
jgi:hypothetical protein